jgi:Carboxypeptidase regulatory-like domain
MGTSLRRMKTTKATKKTSSARFGPFRHPHLPIRHLIFVQTILVFSGLVWLAGGILVCPPAASAQGASGSRAHDFLIFATVFTDQGFALPGARVRVRRTDEKKPKWEATSDRRGEFAVRVPEGAEYEMAVEANGFKREVRKIDAREDTRTDLTIRMDKASGGKS